MTKRLQVTYLGRILGTASGWDGDPGEWLHFNDFEPAEGIDLPKCAGLEINETEAKIKAWDDEGKTVLKVWYIEWTFRLAED